MPRLENWSVTINLPSPYSPPEMGATQLVGNVYGHPKFADGASITTGDCTGLIVDGEAVNVHTKNGSVYTLGAIDLTYEAEYPNALQRMIAGWPQP